MVAAELEVVVNCCDRSQQFCYFVTSITIVT